MIAVPSSSGACLGSRHWESSSLTPELDADARQALANLLPLLICGEESAEHVFEGAAADARLSSVQRDTLQRIAQDEHRHAHWLLDLRARLPTSQDRAAVARAARYLKSLATSDLKTHLLRVAALDGGVCTVLAALTRAGTSIANAPSIRQVFSRIRRDEGMHVRVTRACARSLGATMDDEHNERAAVLQDFERLLAPGAAAFVRLGVDYARLSQRLHAPAEPIVVLRRHG